MKKILGILLVMSVMFTGVAFAESVSGKVAAVDTAANTIEVAKTDAATGAVENVKISVDTATTYTGVAGVAEIKAGDEVKVEAVKDEAAGSLKASSVDVIAAPVAVPAAPAAEPAAAPATM